MRSLYQVSTGLLFQQVETVLADLLRSDFPSSTLPTKLLLDTCLHYVGFSMGSPQSCCLLQDTPQGQVLAGLAYPHVFTTSAALAALGSLRLTLPIASFLSAAILAAQQALTKVDSQLSWVSTYWCVHINAAQSALRIGGIPGAQVPPMAG